MVQTQQALASPVGLVSCALSLFCFTLAGVVLLQQTRKSWEPLLRDDFPGPFKIFSHVDATWTLQSKGLRSAGLLVVISPSATGVQVVGAASGGALAGSTRSISNSSAAPQFPSSAHLDLQASRVAVYDKPAVVSEPGVLKVEEEHGQDKGDEQGSVRGQGTQREPQQHQGDQQHHTEHHGEQAPQQNEEPRQGNEQSEQQSEQNQADQQQQTAQQEQQQQPQPREQQQDEARQPPPEQKQELQQVTQAQGQEHGQAQAQTETGAQNLGPTHTKDKDPGGSGDHGGSDPGHNDSGGIGEGGGGAPPCPGCDLLRLLRYHKPLDQTPPDEPLSSFPDLPPAPTPLLLNGSSRFYVLEAKPDRCAGVMHKRFALRCAVAEARALRRQLAVHMTACLSRAHTKRPLDQWLPFSSYLDLDFISRDNQVDIVYAEQVAAAMIKAQEEGRGEGLSVKTFDKHFPVQRLRDEEGDTTVVVRTPAYWENGFDVCFDPSSKELADHMNPTDLPYNRYLVAIGDEIIAKLGGRHKYVTVHVRRGDKARYPRKWPHVDQDTRPESLRKKLPQFVAPGSVLYIATNEDTPGFFDPLKDMYTIYTLEDFTHLWGSSSTWFHEHSRLMKTDSPEFDVYMKGIVDDHIGAYAEKAIETFNDLTDDPRNGVDVPP